MRITPVVLDARPPYLGARANDSTLLQLPVGSRSLLAEIAERVARVTAQPPLVLPTMDVDEAYGARIASACPAVEAIINPANYRDPLAHHDACDSLLVVSPSCYPAEGLDLASLLSVPVQDARMARHLLAFEASSLRTKELVHAGADGRVRRIQRYFDPVTWPFPGGMIASLVPVACLLTHSGLPLGSLKELRKSLAARGVPNQDLASHGEFFDLRDESAALALVERRLLSLARRKSASRLASVERDPLWSPTARVHPSARVVGPVLLSEGVSIAESAVVLGPTVLGPDVTIGAGAMVAQCFVAERAQVAAGATVRHHVVANSERPADHRALYRRHTPVSKSPSINDATPSPHLEYAFVKHIVESAIAAVTLVVISPLIAAVALLVKLTSNGPVFYGDRREGLGGRPFKCWKFRSMRTNADAAQRMLAAQQQMDGPQFKMDHDPRVTPIGQWLRRLNVDELPQLFNVVRGEMSFVGPRPSPFRENQICIPWRNGRLSVRPGITGLWQVCRHDRANGDFHQWIEYDLLYVRHMSFLLDCKIFLATLVTAGGKRPVPVSMILGNIEPLRLPIPSEMPCSDVMMESSTRRAAERPAAAFELR